MSNHSSSLRYELTYYHTSNCSGSLDGYFVSPSRHGQFCRTLLGVQDLNLRTLDYASSKIDHFSNSHRLLHYLGYNSLYQLPSDSQSESETSRTSLLLLYENQTPQYYPSIVTSKLHTFINPTIFTDCRIETTKDYSFFVLSAIILSTALSATGPDPSFLRIPAAIAEDSAF